MHRDYVGCSQKLSVDKMSGRIQSLKGLKFEWAVLDFCPGCG